MKTMIPRDRSQYSKNFFVNLPAMVTGAALCSLLLAPAAVTAQDDKAGFLGPKSSLDFHGYTRLGLGASGEGGGTQAEFRYPEHDSTFRLGNEPNTNIELAWDYTYDLSDTILPEQDSKVQLFFMLDDFKEFGDSSDVSVGNVQNAYAKFHDFLPNGIDVWIGRRYYKRMGIHANDNFWLNTGQGAHAGAGLEDIPMPSGDLSVAVFRYEDDPAAPVLGLDELGNAGDDTINSTALDVRWENINLAENHTLAFYFGTTYRSGQEDGLQVSNKDGLQKVDSEVGFAGGAWITSVDPLGFGGNNRLATMYREGAAMVQGTFNGRPIRENSKSGFDLDDSERFEINNAYTVNTSLVGAQVVAGYIREQRGVDGVKPGAGDTLEIWTLGVRPHFFLSQYVSVVTEVGTQYFDDEINDVSGDLTKATLALQLHPEAKFFSRPVLRAFVTGATWSSEFKGLSGSGRAIGSGPDDAPFGDDTNGYTFGVQWEAWW